MKKSEVSAYWGQPQLKEDYTPQPYIKVTANIVVMDKTGKRVGTKKQTFWAFAKEIRGKHNVLQEVTREGTKKDVIAIVTEADVLKVERGLVNKHYGELEVIPAKPATVVSANAEIKIESS